MVGKINAITMIVLPHFLHLFQSLPCFVALSYFKQLDSIIIPFIWNYKAVRITKKRLSKSKDVGGFSLPSFKMCYWAANVSILAWWKKGLQLYTDSCPAWLQIESSVCKKTSLLALLNSPTAAKGFLFCNSIVVGNTSGSK